MLSKLNNILLSDKVVEAFYENYEGDFKSWLNEVLPEIEDCQNLQQDNPWHIYNCLDHILHSVENINNLTQGKSQEDRRLLAYVMFLHDIGKPSCLIRRYSKLYCREVDSFFGHNKKSVDIAERVLSDLGFNKEKSNIIKKLIDKHDVFMFITLRDDGNKFHRVLSEKLIEDEIKELDEVGDGKQLLKDLILVGKADNLSQNPKMTKDSLELLDKMLEMANSMCETEMI